eukprot:1416558-Amphidinium_carterae.1
MLKPPLPHASEAGFASIGKFGCRKTPLNVLAMAISGHHGARVGLDCPPSFRTTSNLNLFRGEPRETHVPFVWYDGEVCSEEA